MRQPRVRGSSHWRVAAGTVLLLSAALSLEVPRSSEAAHRGAWHTIGRASKANVGVVPAFMEREVNEPSWNPAISADGRFIVFGSFAGFLVAGDTNNKADIFIYDIELDLVKRVSISSSGEQGNDHSGFQVFRQRGRPSISGDGRLIAFDSFASNLVDDDTNGVSDVFVHDQVSGTTMRASISSSGLQANGKSFDPYLSADGRFLAFVSGASNFDERCPQGGIFVRDLQNGTIECVSVTSTGAPANDGVEAPALSADGRFVVFVSGASNFVPERDAYNNAFVKDRQSGLVELINVSTAGVPGNTGALNPDISADGRFAVYESDASNLVENDTGERDIFLRDRALGTTTRVSVATNGAQANWDSVWPAISGNGRFVAFSSQASNLTSDDTNGDTDVFVRDLLTGALSLVSITNSGAKGNALSGPAVVSGDGTIVAFGSWASNLVEPDHNGNPDILFARRLNTAPFAIPFDSGRVLYAGRTWVLRTATFTDPDPGDTHTALINWGDGTSSSGVVDEISGSISGVHGWTNPGAFLVTVTVSDAAGISDEASLEVAIRRHPRGRR